MPPRRAAKKQGSSSATTTYPCHAYTPLGQATEDEKSSKQYWKAFKRRVIDAPKSSLVSRQPDVATTEQDNDQETYRIGTVVLVKHTTTEPVVGLITEMWSMSTGDDSDDDDEDDDEEEDDGDFVPLWCKIRFFYSPTQLTNDTKKRLSGLIGKNEIFYTHKLSRLVPSARRTNRSQAAAEGFNQQTDDFAEGHSLLESDGFPVSDIIGQAFIHSTQADADLAAKDDKSAPLLHRGKIVPHHMFCIKAVDPMKELFWNIDCHSIFQAGKHDKGWDVRVEEEHVRGRALKDWADEEKKRARKSGKPIIEADAVVVKGHTKSGRAVKKAPKGKVTQNDDSDSDLSSLTDSESEPESDFGFIQTGKQGSRKGWKGKQKAKNSARDKNWSSSEGEDSDDDSTAATSDEEEDEDEEEEFEDYESDSSQQQKLKRRRRGGVPHTPRKNRTYASSIAKPTPRSRRIIDLRREAREKLHDRSQAASSGAFLPDPTSSLPLQLQSAEELAKMTPHERAKRLLHVSTTPLRLPCRTAQADNLLCLLEDCLDTGVGSCIYISGVPGTGKTATVRGVISQLQQRSATGQVNPFDFLEINGMKVADAGEAYSMLWSVVGDRGGYNKVKRSPKAALNLLSKHYASSSKSSFGLGPGRAATIVLMDELDQLLTSRQDVMYNLFNWPSSRNSRLIVVAVANTMDLPERTMSAKVASRLGMTRITFMPYADRELGEIVRSRLGIGADGKSLPLPSIEEDSVAATEDPAAIADSSEGGMSEKQCNLYSLATSSLDSIFVNDAITYASKRISNVSGDARRMLDVCRRAVELVEEQHRLAIASASAATVGATTPNTTSDPAASAVTATPLPMAPPPKVTIATIRQILDSMIKSSLPSHMLRSLSLQCKVALISLLHLARKKGVPEVEIREWDAHATALSRLHGITLPGGHTVGGHGDNDPLAGTQGGTTRVAKHASTLSSLHLVIPVGTSVGPGRAAGLARVILSVREDEVRLALESDEDPRVRGLL